jgi:hypothetical protein
LGSISSSSIAARIVVSGPGSSGTCERSNVDKGASYRGQRVCGSILAEPVDRSPRRQDHGGADIALLSYDMTSSQCGTRRRCICNPFRFGGQITSESLCPVEHSMCQLSWGQAWCEMPPKDFGPHREDGRARCILASRLGRQRILGEVKLRKVWWVTRQLHQNAYLSCFGIGQPGR